MAEALWGRTGGVITCSCAGSFLSSLTSRSVSPRSKKRLRSRNLAKDSDFLFGTVALRQLPSDYPSLISFGGIDGAICCWLLICFVPRDVMLYPLPGYCSDLATYYDDYACLTHL